MSEKITKSINIGIMAIIFVLLALITIPRVFADPVNVVDYYIHSDIINDQITVIDNINSQISIANPVLNSGIWVVVTKDGQPLKDRKITEIIFSKLFWKYITFYLLSNPNRIFEQIFKRKKSNIYNLKQINITYPKYIDDYLLFCMTTNLKSLLKWEDKNSMRFSIESRVPYLDYRLVEFAFSLPYYFKIKNFETKHIFRKTIKNYVPKKIIERKDKIGFATPEKDWLKTKDRATKQSVHKTSSCKYVALHGEKIKEMAI